MGYPDPLAPGAPPGTLLGTALAPLPGHTDPPPYFGDALAAAPAGPDPTAAPLSAVRTDPLSAPPDPNRDQERVRPIAVKIELPDLDPDPDPPTMTLIVPPEALPASARPGQPPETLPTAAQPEPPPEDGSYALGSPPEDGSYALGAPPEDGPYAPELPPAGGRYELGLPRGWDLPTVPENRGWSTPAPPPARPRRRPTATRPSRWPSPGPDAPQAGQPSGWPLPGARRAGQPSGTRPTQTPGGWPLPGARQAGQPSGTRRTQTPGGWPPPVPGTRRGGLPPGPGGRRADRLAWDDRPGSAGDPAGRWAGSAGGRRPAAEDASGFGQRVVNLPPELVEAMRRQQEPRTRIISLRLGLALVFAPVAIELALTHNWPGAAILAGIALILARPRPNAAKRAAAAERLRRANAPEWPRRSP